MEGKTRPGENQHDEEYQEQKHAGIVPATWRPKPQSVKGAGGWQKVPEQCLCLRRSAPAWLACRNDDRNSPSRQYW
jgi:hypothetical protein